MFLISSCLSLRIRQTYYREHFTGYEALTKHIQKFLVAVLMLALHLSFSIVTMHI